MFVLENKGAMFLSSKEMIDILSEFPFNPVKIYIHCRHPAESKNTWIPFGVQDPPQHQIDGSTTTRLTWSNKAGTDCFTDCFFTFIEEMSELGHPIERIQLLYENGVQENIDFGTRSSIKNA